MLLGSSLDAYAYDVVWPGKSCMLENPEDADGHDSHSAPASASASSAAAATATSTHDHDHDHAAEQTATATTSAAESCHTHGDGEVSRRPIALISHAALTESDFPCLPPPGALLVKSACRPRNERFRTTVKRSPVARRRPCARCVGVDSTDIEPKL